MPQIGNVSPWLTMWSCPKSTVRAIVHSNPSYGVIWLGAMYALQTFFFYANWWSFGLNTHYYTILIAGIILSPFIGFIWIYYLSLIFYLTGRLLRGGAPVAHVRAAIAWSLIPVSINLLMWLILIFMSPDHAFVQDSAGPSSVFINLIGFILGIWSVILLIQGLREVQQFTISKSIANVFLAWFFSTLILLLLFLIGRYIYLAIK